MNIKILEMLKSLIRGGCPVFLILIAAFMQYLEPYKLIKKYMDKAHMMFYLWEDL